MTLKLVFIASLLYAQRYRGSVEKNPVSLLVPLRTALSGTTHFGVLNRWPATSRQALYSALIPFS